MVRECFIIAPYGISEFLASGRSAFKNIYTGDSQGTLLLLARHL